MCMTVELYRTADNSSQFYECAPLAQEEVIEYNLTDKYLGVWNLRDCPENFDFDVARQKCLERKTMRRQQAACAQNPASTGCQAPCSGAVSSPIIGSPCDWKETGLHPDPKSNAYFVQCSPQSSGMFAANRRKYLIISSNIKLHTVHPPCNLVPEVAPLETAAIRTPLGFCSSGMCSGGGSCYQPGGCCCQEVVKLPVCANGQQSQRRCSVDAECGPRMECSNGGCCPMPFCPTGVQAQLRCNNNNMMCAMGHESVQDPWTAAGLEWSVLMGHAVLFRHVPTTMCPLRGGLALTLCGPRACPVGSECVNGGCCPLPRCPSGLQATQRCQMGIGCARGHQCENGVCCAMPMCSTGIIAASVCGMGNSCPMGFVCEGESEEAAARNRLHSVPMVAELPKDVTEVLNALQVLDAHLLEAAVCYPWSQYVQQGLTPFASAHRTVPVHPGPPAQWERAAPKVNTVALFNQIPGSQCQASTQCNGYSTSCAQCTQGICACVNGAASNGASCLQMSSRILTLARNGCDQYGSPCTVLLSTARRKPIIAPVGNITETPLFFNVANERKCVANATDVNFDPDSTCLPNEKCINGECRMKLWPGEYGCSTDEECTSRCPNTYCEKKKSDKNVAQCQCRDGQLLFGRCFSQCPQGFHESGAYCMHDDEDAFWSDGDAQDRIKALLNSSPC
ncbi:EB module [Ancylostoma ceylanicum]|uniref:EB module n=1 Tax=Ancylostoma ceylanicum TaxID=53326 RepID=A0A0D6LY20_9BILA|nr:EB module [Ancylostoma ceylanicum]